MVAASSELLGVGLYTPEEAALYARVSSRMMTRWLYGSAVGEAVMRPQIEDQQERLVTFLDFVQTLAVRAVRLDHRVPLQKIRHAIEKAEREYDVPYPLARMHTTYLLGTELVIKLREDEYVQLSGKHKDNRLITKVAEFYMIDLTFNTQGLASAYRPFKWGNLEIKMDPKIRFGEPLVSTCGYSARALWEAFKSEGSLEAAAEAYGVKTEEVEAGCRYFDHVLGSSAA
jgi:uncharacterized protein (DUF433 family)